MLEDYKDAREEIEEQLQKFEEEYGQWVTDALEAQEEQGEHSFLRTDLLRK